MDAQALSALFERVRTGEVGVNDAVERLRHLPFSESPYAKVDHHRELRQGMPEVVFGEVKTVDEIVGIVEALSAAGQNVLVTRVDAEKGAAAQAALPELRFERDARCLVLLNKKVERAFSQPIPVVTAGTSDLPVAWEAAWTLRLGGAECEVVSDVGVAGLHRLFSVLPSLQQAPAIICIAGMEGALPSVVGGLVRCPVVAVPTSIGYGAALGGAAALLGMLTACASGVSVVNIDNGFGAAMAVLRMRHLLSPGNDGVNYGG